MPPIAQIKVKVFSHKLNTVPPDGLLHEQALEIELNAFLTIMKNEGKEVLGMTAIVTQSFPYPAYVVCIWYKE